MNQEQIEIIKRMRELEKQGIRLTTEELLNEIEPEPNERRRDYSNALQELIWKLHFIRDVDGVLELRERAKVEEL